MLPCVLPLSLRRTSLDTSELKTVKLLHLSGSPSPGLCITSWTLYFYYFLTPRLLFTGTFTSMKEIC
jgi:hypothetical protein